ncbi:SseB family protein [Streptomyces sp. NBC_00572]|uniref:SseB family protein n=1 Tax=Streptomyces sp. NBC_00572 TaxID=2903664 RepID=UPI00224DCA25|nr:SseB family protein [Streptomyces sp. NBC_00572]MCX4981969.1 SseB family protein [Streptomyces sp. NBC_00572]
MTEYGDEAPQAQQVSRLAELADGPDSAMQPESDSTLPPARPAPKSEQVDETALAHREFARVLGEFRRTAVLVPFDEQESLWTADFNGVRWICAFSDEEALARFAMARGDAGREWTYQTILGARLLDVMVPMLPGPGGVALDAGSADGMLFPPVAGIVPDEVAVDLGGTGTR